MKNNTAIIFYSWSGSTKRLAQTKAEEMGAEIFELKDKYKPNALKAYTLGCIRAIKGKKTPIQNLDINMNDYNKIIIMSPVWAGHTTPAINNIFELLPSGKEIEVYMVSASGKSSCEDKVKKVINEKDCKLIKFEDIKK